MRAPVRLAVMTSALIASFALAVAAEPLTKRDTQGPVTVSATIMMPVATDVPLRLKIVLDTHSVGLDDFKFEEAVALRAADGTDVAPTTVEAKGGGHHREAVLTFPPTGSAAQVQVVVKNIGGVVERSFAWDLSTAR